MAAADKYGKRLDCRAGGCRFDAGLADDAAAAANMAAAAVMDSGCK